MDFTFSLAIGYYWLIFFGTLSVFLLTGFYWISFRKYRFSTPNKIRKNKKYKCGRFSLYITLLSFILLTLAWIINPVTCYEYEIPFIL